MRRSGI